MARTFRRLNPGTDWDSVVVNKDPDAYKLEFRKGTSAVCSIKLSGSFGRILQELQAIGCNVSHYRQHLPTTHMDI